MFAHPAIAYPWFVRPALACLLLPACAAARAVPDTAAIPAPPQAAPLPETLTFQTDVAPIRALTDANGFLWIGSARGLRRLRLPAGPAEWVGGETGLPGHGVSALAHDASGQLLVATESEVGRLADASGRLRYQPSAKIAGATHLATTTEAAGAGAARGIWVGTSRGLFFVAERHGVAVPIPGASGVAVTSLDVDADGSSAWVGLAGRGLVHVDAHQVIASVGPQAAAPLDFTDCVGTALLPNGTRIAAGRGARGGTRMVLLRRSGPELLDADSDIHVLYLLGAAGHPGPLLVATVGSAGRLFAVEVADRGQVASAGVIRFTPARKNLQALRLLARPDPRAVPPEVTVAIMASDTGNGDRSAAGARGEGDANIFVGTRAVGVARLAAAAPTYLPAGELALGAQGLAVACLAQERCVFSTGYGPGWIWEGGDHVFKPIPDGAIDGRLMTLAGDGRSAVYFVAGGADKTIRIARLSSDGARWEPLMSIPVRVEGTPIVTAASLSPEGNLWMSVRDRAPSGQESGRGVIELRLPGGQAIHHRPYRDGEPRAPENIPVAGDVTAVRFAKGTGPADPQAVWFCTSLGVLRFVGGQLSQWGENDGLESESCTDLDVAPAGVVWVTTAAGVAFFDGKNWRRSDKGWPVTSDGEGVAGRALVNSGDGLWAGTQRGLWLVSVPAGNAPPRRRPIDHNTGLVDDDVTDLVSDRFGRLWVLGHLGVTIRRPLSATPNSFASAAH